MTDDNGNENAEDERLLLDYRDAGHVESMDALVSRNAKWMMAYLRSMLSSVADADDAFQDVWIRIIRGSKKYRSGNFRGWVMRLSHNVVIDQYRRQKPNVSIDCDDSGGVGLVESIQDNSPGPGVELASADDSAAIMSLVRALPEVQREVFLMRVEGDLSFKEISEITNTPINTVLARMHYAVERLKKQITPVAGGDYERN